MKQIYALGSVNNSSAPKNSDIGELNENYEKVGLSKVGQSSYKNSQSRKVNVVSSEVINALKIEELRGNKAVSARALYNFLELAPSQWRRWSKKNIEDDVFFVEGVDYEGFDIMSNGNETKDFIISIDFAKHLCMLCRNEKGKEARQYFINIEKQSATPMSPLEILKYQVEVMEQQQREIESLKLEQMLQANKLLEIESKMTTKDTDYYTISGWAKLNGYSTDRKLANKLGRQCSSICNTRKLHKGKEYDAKYGEVNTYPSSILREVFDNYFDD